MANKRKKPLQRTGKKTEPMKSQTELVPIEALSNNPSNPRTINEEQYGKLKQSLIDFPEMLQTRPLIADKNGTVIGGNMRLQVLRDLAITEVPVIFVDWDEKQQQQFVIKDNVNFGQWDWDVLANEWDIDDLSTWGLDLWKPEDAIDYSALDDLSLDDELAAKEDGVMRAIQIEFQPGDYEVATELIKFWRSEKSYIGAMIIEKLQEEKDLL